MDAIVDQVRLPDARFDAERYAFKAAPAVLEGRLAQALHAFTVRQQLWFEVAPLHGPSATLLCTKGIV